MDVMKTTEKNISSNRISGLSDHFSHPEEVLFLDIETTGFSPRSASIYLIGCAYFTRTGWRIRQFFAQTPAQEGEIVKAFSSFASTFSRFVHFNGLTFDVPFLQAKCKKHAVPVFSPRSQCDIYKRISPYKNMLHLPGCRQKQLEEFIGIAREDIFNGGQLIELYHAYGESRDERLQEVLLLHNADDLAGMLQLYAVMSIPMLFEEGLFSVEEAYIQEKLDVNGNPGQEFHVRLSADFPLPVPLSCHGSEGILQKCFLSGNGRTVLIRLPVYEGELKYFYPDYKNYAYLPAEDQAIHKSVAVYVDKSQRMPATAATCYTRKAGSFLPWFGGEAEKLPLFKVESKDKQRWFLPDEDFLSDKELQKEYIRMCLGLLRK